MFGLGMPEILLILAIALIVIGPKKLPDLAKTLGRALGEFKSAAQDFKRSMDVETPVKKFNEPVDTVTQELKDAVETAKVRGKRDFGDLAGSMADANDESVASPDAENAKDPLGEDIGSPKSELETDGEKKNSPDGERTVDDIRESRKKDAGAS